MPLYSCKKIRSKAAYIDVHFFRTKKREDKSSLAVKTIQAPIQFQHIAKRVRSRTQSRANHVHHANTLPDNRPASVHSLQYVFLNSGQLF